MTADTSEIVAVTTRLAWLVDRREWEALNGLFATHVDLDYTSLNGGEPATLTRDEIVAGWRSGLEGLDATQHLVSGHLVEVDGDRASCTAQFQATHVLSDPSLNPYGGSTWTLGGHYRYTLLRAGGGGGSPR